MKRGELLVFDQPEPCPYLLGRVARMPLRRPLRLLTRPQLDERLSEGDRRCGEFLYRTQCSTCRACEPIRVDVEKFRASRSQRRTCKRGEQLLQLEISAPRSDDQHLALFNEHRAVRNLDHHTGPLDRASYSAFLEDTCCETLEIRYQFESQLVAVAVMDVGETSLSAVYCFYNPRFRRLSLGTYSVLKQIELCQKWGKTYLYLGLYIADSIHMSYKSTYRPHERLIDGVWRQFDGDINKPLLATQGMSATNKKS